MVTIISDPLPTMPWQDRPADCTDIVWRDTRNPIISRKPFPDAQGVYNSAVIPFAGGFLGVLRVEHEDAMPRLHLARSADGIDWDIDEQVLPMRSADPAITRRAYTYDPRVLLHEDGWYYITWCNDYHGPTIGVARTKDFVDIEQLENAFLPFNRNGVLFPKLIDGAYAMLSRPSDNGHTPFGDIYLSRSPDMVHWGRHRYVMGAGGQWWQSVKIGAGPIPLETDRGWLMLYHGVIGNCNGFVYSMGAALLDRDDPAKVLRRGDRYLLTPIEPYETTGFVPNVCFPCAALCDGDSGRLAIYYGAADTHTCLCYSTVDSMLDWLDSHDMA